MVVVQQLTSFLNKELAIKSIEDDSRNGLQVKGKSIVKKAALGVDACIELFQKAKQKRCELIIVHHGLIWKGKKDILDVRKKRIDFLRKNRLSLYAAHLPLDRHSIYGNNILLAQLLCLKDIKPFAKYNGKNIGFYGSLRTKVEDVIWKLEHSFHIKCTSQIFNGAITRKVGIVSGSAPELIYECKKLGIDTFVTGEPRHSYYHIAKELKMNVIYAGHYATETLGVKALGELIKHKFNIDTVFIEARSGL